MGSQKIIVCECGAEILLMPDVKEMDRAIFNHAEWHASREKDPAKAEAILEQIQSYLIKRVLEAANKQITTKQQSTPTEQSEKRF